ncbi:unnamed protein product [Rotaria sordida]|uniref:J domain-containing protein n=1 Tax=Rotaria sordida TaxID=392033 RepID=A0A814C0U2_9BILA|nr:unnamed protein product [Rotaria sordida]CAF3659048.1 unnamed protein product [Rotaria sordida]
MAGKTGTPYDILEVTKENNDYQLRVAYRQKIHQFKADQLKPPANRTINDKQFQQICRAYETLSDYDKRKRYNERQEWISDLHESKYTLQQLAAEPLFAEQLKQRLINSKLRQINAQDPITGQTPLYCAARTCNIEAVQYLIEQGADPDLVQRTGSTALHVASFYGHPEIVQCLLESGTDYTLKNSSNNLPETESYNDQVKETFTKLKQIPFVQAAANQLNWFKENISNIKEHIDTQYYVQRQTLLHCAAKKGHFELVQWLVEERSANIDIVDINLNSALHLASYGGHSLIVEYLLNQGADSTLINKWGMTAEQEGLIHKTKITQLFQSMKEQNMFDMAVNGFDWWFRYYFDDNSPNTIDGRGTSILYVACRFGKTSVAKWLLDKGATINFQLPGQRSTPLHAAAFHGHKSTVELLLSRSVDINIQNQYGATALDEAQTDEIKTLLQQYRENLSVEKLISVHLYGDGTKSGNEPIAKVQLHYDATIDDLIKAIPPSLGNSYRWFSVARSPLAFENNNINLVSAVCRARHANTKFIDLPICLITYTSPRYMNSGYTTRKQFPAHNLRSFQSMFRTQSKMTSFHIEAKSNNIQTFNIENLLFNFAPNCANNDVSIKINYIIEPDAEQFDLSECICLFETEYNDNDDKLNDMPTVTVKNESNVKLYTWISNSAHWFSYSNQSNRLPRIGSKHALIRQVEIIPKQLYLLPDMFIQAAVGRPLQPCQNPVPCQYLKIRDHDSENFPHTAYHGTSIGVIRSILMDGLVMANTVVSSGIRVCPPKNHIARGVEAFGIKDFANAIFVSPSIHYCSDPVYAVSFSNNDQLTIVVLECRVKKGAFDAFKSTVPTYVAKPGDNLDAIEWRITSPACIQITGILFIPIIKSIAKASKSRADKLGIDPNSMT